MDRTLTNFTVFVSTPPRIEIRGGVASIHMRSGDQGFELAMPVPVLSRTCDRVQRAVKRFASGQENIVIDD